MPRTTYALNTQAPAELVHTAVLCLHIGEGLAELVGSLSEATARILGENEGAATTSLVGLGRKSRSSAILGTADGAKILQNAEGVLEIEAVAVKKGGRL